MVNFVVVLGVNGTIVAVAVYLLFVADPDR